MAGTIRMLASGGAVAALAGLLFAGLYALPQAIADDQILDTLTGTAIEALPPPFDADSLVKFEGRDYAVTYSEDVSMDVESRSTIRKIAYGRTSFVEVTTTSSGTYSSEALFSPHVRYPGVYITPVRNRAAPVGFGGAMAYWSPRRGWVPLAMVDAGSFAVVSPINGGTVISGSFGTCVLGRNVANC